MVATFTMEKIRDHREVLQQKQFSYLALYLFLFLCFTESDGVSSSQLRVLMYCIKQSCLNE
jgi:hypothetical protein